MFAAGASAEPPVPMSPSSAVRQLSFEADQPLVGMFLLGRADLDELDISMVLAAAPAGMKPTAARAFAASVLPRPRRPS